jgi:anhydro-N-acetylmuramic acid kinase
MSGTSCDGISAALIRTSGQEMERKVTLVAHEMFPFSTEMRDRIMDLYPPNQFTAEAFCRARVVLGQFFAEAVQRLLATAGVQPHEVSVVGAQGTTLYHDPPGPENQHHGGQVEIAEPAIIAERTGILTVSDLRPADMAAGGHGAPLSAYVDFLFFHDNELSRAVQNIGGIANATITHAGAGMDEIMSFDTGPGNMLIDAAVRRITDGEMQYDRDGHIAATGKVSESLLAWLLTHPYLSESPPKTTGRDTFGDAFFAEVLTRADDLSLSGEDLVRTLTAFTAETIALAYERFAYPQGKLDEVVVSGGGIHNPTLMQLMADRLAPVPVRTHADFGLSNDAREAITWAILADETLLGNPANVPHATGARHPVILGSISLPPPREDG